MALQEDRSNNNKAALHFSKLSLKHLKNYMTDPLSCAEAEGPAAPTLASTNSGAPNGLSMSRNRKSKVPIKRKEEDKSKQEKKDEGVTADDDDKHQKSKRKKRNSNGTTTSGRRSFNNSPAKRRSGDGFFAGLLAIGIYALMHESGILTILLLAFVWWYSLEESHQRIFLFFLVVLNFAEYFYLLPPVLARYQQEDWWDVPTIKTALLTMGIFWSIAWVSAATGSYLDNKEQRLRLEREKKRLEQEAVFLQHQLQQSAQAASATTTTDESH